MKQKLTSQDLELANTLLSAGISQTQVASHFKVSTLTLRNCIISKYGKLPNIDIQKFVEVHINKPTALPNSLPNLTDELLDKAEILVGVGRSVESIADYLKIDAVLLERALAKRGGRPFLRFSMEDMWLLAHYVVKNIPFKDLS